MSIKLLFSMLSRFLSTAKTPLLSAVLLLVACGSPAVFAQTTFNSGSTGADGALNDTTLPASCTRTQTTITCVLPASGVYNFTTVTIAAGVTLRFTKNARNTPVTILATGDVTINGMIDVSGVNAAGIAGGDGGSGGFRGGDGGLGVDPELLFGKTGEGPGGGGGGKCNSCQGGGGGFGTDGFASVNAVNAPTAGNGGAAGKRYGSRTLLPLIGGSGGGGEAATSTRPGRGGGGGGGAILIASSGNITFGNSSSGISARGGDGLDTSNGGGGGAGGGIRLIANTISGSPTLNISGGRAGEQYGGNPSRGGAGYARIEANNYNTFFPNSSAPNYSLARPNPVTIANAPQLKITAVGGVNAPVNPLGSFTTTPDITVPTTTANPVTVALQANNIPVGTVVSLTLTQENGDRATVSSTALAGTLPSSTATASLTLPTAGVSVITATASVDGLIAFNQRPVFIDGEQVKRVEIAATFGGQSRVTYITASGKRVALPTE